MQAHPADERERREAHRQHLVARIDRLSRDGRSHDRRPRRPPARAGLHQRVDGGSQARRVRADPDLPRPRRLRQARKVADGGRAQEGEARRLRRSSRRSDQGRRPRRKATRARRPRRKPGRAKTGEGRAAGQKRQPARRAGGEGKAGGEGRSREGRAGSRSGGDERRPRRPKRRQGRAKTGDQAAPARRTAGSAQTGHAAQPRADSTSAPVVRAQAKYVRSSARKARLVIEHIRGKPIDGGARGPPPHARAASRATSRSF